MLKLDAPAASTPPVSEPATADSELGGGDMSSENPGPSDDKPFDDEPFDAGVEADEETDPKKYIEQLTGKLGQSLRTYNDNQGQPDFELEKFAINSLLSATHTSEMDSEDQDDIIKKVKEAGKNDETNDTEDNGEDFQSDEESGTDNFSSDDTQDSEGFNSEGDLEENLFEKEEGFLIKPKKSSIFAPEGSEEANFKHKIVEKLHETFNQEDEMNTEPQVEPQVIPAPDKVQPNIAPSRRNKPFLPMPNIKPDPKARQ